MNPQTGLPSNTTLWVSYLLGVGVLTIVILIPSLQFLATPSWDSPGGSDAIFAGIFIKTLVETGGITFNPSLGAPFGSDLAAFPSLDGTIILILKLLTLFSSDSTLILNLFFVISFYLVYTSAFFVMVGLGIRYELSLVLALLFSFLPYHFLRNVNHLALSAYYAVPLWTYLALRITTSRGVELLLPKNLLKLFLLLLLTIIASTSGGYYLFFGIIIFLMALLLNVFGNQRPYVVRYGLFVFAAVSLGVILNTLPFLQYLLSTDRVSIAARSLFESDLYGLRIAQLLFPISAHQISAVGSFAAQYHDALRPVTEASSSALGIVASLGFLFLIAISIFGYRLCRDRTILLISKLNLTLLLFSTVGGFSVLFAALFTAQFRASNRASIFIAFFALTALGLLLGRHFERFQKSLSTRVLSYCLLTLFSGVALYDQTPRGFFLSSAPTHQVEVKSFVGQLEESLSRGSQIYTYPYIEFPEAAPLHKEGYNGMMRPYFYSNHLRWSYGAIKTSHGDSWFRALEEMQPDQRLASIRTAGFEGIFVDKFAIKSDPDSFENFLRSTQLPRQTSSEGRYVFYRLTPPDKRIMNPAVAVAAGRGFYQKEVRDEDFWNWSGGVGHLKLHNYGEATKETTVRFDLQALDNTVIKVHDAEKKIFVKELRAGERVEIEFNYSLKPGVSGLELRSSGSSHVPKGDSRKLSFRVFNYGIREL